MLLKPRKVVFFEIIFIMIQFLLVKSFQFTFPPPPSSSSSSLISCSSIIRRNVVRNWSFTTTTTTTRSSSSSSSTTTTTSLDATSSHSDSSNSNISRDSSKTQLNAGAPGKKPARFRVKSRRENLSKIDTKTLEWEKFDFSEFPKWDQRFGGNNNDDNNDDNDDDGSSGSRRSSRGNNNDDIHLASNREELEKIAEREEVEDRALQKRFEREHQLWENLDPILIEQATNVLLPFIMPERLERIQTLLSKRTGQTRFLFENPCNPSNVWACLRTLDSFGIQHVDVVVQSGRYKGKAALSQKRGMRTAMGSAKWLTVKNHLNTLSALEGIKKEGYHVLCTDVNPSSKDIRDIDWDASGKPICIVMGNEQYGISPEVKEMADESFYLPMVGMAESFNLSVATAITCAHLSAASGEDGKGPLRAGDLSEQECKTLLLKGALNTINQKLAAALFRKHGVQLPKEFNIS